MPTRVLNRRVMRERHDEAEPTEETTGSSEVPAEAVKTRKPRTRKAAGEKPAKVKAPAKPRARKKSLKAPQRMFARWAVCDNGLKRVAIFEYRDRDGADAKLAEMLEKKPGAFFLLLVKDPYDPPPPAAAEEVAARN